ncbi:MULTISPECIES: Wzz/FepE/Etk N-terminal domain-containing protein [unclassified Pseudomonas]|uniref:Wzz/FepE/Etk N-terminal domain-containing protein n=1 Tax=unclassified Pseudomonas TaxID=196821 RepID=UPI0009E7696D|nr:MULTISPECIES: Wzz/FepE/Etk N-terminal domain-containing protein [unclassified Pseudomonas]
MNNHSPVTPSKPINEVDLVDLIRILWQQKMLIILTAIIFAVVASLYAYFSKPAYVARINLQAPLSSDVAVLNYSGIKQFVPDEVYILFTRELQSDKVRIDLYKDVYLPSKSETSSAAFSSAAELSNHITVSGVAPGRFTITAQGSTPEELPMYLEGLLKTASDSTKQKVLKNLSFEAESAAQRYEQLIAASREVTKTKRLDEISRLQDSLRIAESLNIEKPSSSLTANDPEDLAYLRGTLALKAEINSLQHRTNDDPYIKKFRESVFQKEFFSSINVKPTEFSVYSQEGPIESLGPIKPRSSMVIAIGIIFGALVGVVIALIRCFARKQQPLT